MDRKRKSLIVYPRFQLSLIAVNLIIMTITFVAVVLFVSRSFLVMKGDATGAGIGPEHSYFGFIDLQMQYIYIYLGGALFVGFVISTAATLVLSHRVAGPIVRLKGYFKEITDNNNGDENIGEIKFRTTDFFGDLPPLVNSAIKTLKTRKAGSSQKGFTLVELMISVGILSVIALGFSNMMVNTAKEQKRAEVKNNMMRLNLQVQAAATDAGTIFNSRNATMWQAGNMAQE